MAASLGKRLILPTSSRPKSADLRHGAGVSEEPKRRRHVYGRTHGKTLRARQANLMETLLPGVSISLEEGEVAPAALFGPETREFWLEIGFGGGEHLAFQAARNPDVGIIGCEPFINGVAKLVDEIEREKLGNIRIHADDARFLLEKLKPGSISRVFILYPDPWPKKRHKKRRFINDETLALIARALKKGGELRFASDIPDYVAWTLAHIRRHNVKGRSRFEWQADAPADWRERPADWHETRYEAKAIREGRIPAYLGFRHV